MSRSKFIWLVVAGNALAATVLVLLADWISDRARERGVEQAQVACDIAASGLYAQVLQLVRDAPELVAAPEHPRWSELLHAARAPLRLTILAADGAILGDSVLRSELWQNHANRPEIRAALESGEGRAVRFSASAGLWCCYAARTSAPKEAPRFVARAALPLIDVYAAAQRLRHGLWLVAAGIMLLGLAQAWLLPRAMGRLSKQLSQAADLSGQSSLADAAQGWPEFRAVGAAFERARFEHLERLNSLAADRNKVRAILAAMVEGVIAVDDEDRVVHLNAVAALMLRLSPEEVEGQRIWEVTRAVEVSAILEQARDGERELTGEATLAAGTPQERRLELRASPLRDHGGAVAGSVVVLNDVTRLRRLESLRRDFVANVSHELKTPLTAIRGIVETLLDDAEMDAVTRKQFLTRVRDQSGRLSRLVGDLLALARIESPDRALQLISIDLLATLRECAARFEPMCAAKQIQLVRDLPTAAVRVRGEEESLRQIVDNLLDNAVKYTPSGGRVVLRLSVEAGTASGRGAATITVEDTGIGIEPSDVERVFERFYRVDSARSRELGGTGLGLSIVKNTVQALGGSVALESTPGRGSTFRVRLPLDGSPVSAA